MRSVYITGVGMTPFGRHENASLIDLAVDAASQALAEAGLGASDIGALYLGSFLARSLDRQGLPAALVANKLGMGSCAATTLEAACASGQVALRHGVIACGAGTTEAALCVGVERMTAFNLGEVTAGLAEGAERASDFAAGMTFPAFFGLVASAHATRYGTTPEQLAAVPVKSRRHARTNPKAMFRAPITVEGVLASRLIADPLRLHVAPKTMLP